MRKTKKYYRDKINKSYRDACEVFSEACIKYIPKKHYTVLGKNHISQDLNFAREDRVSNGWNGDIEGFYVTNTRPKKVYVNLYVQGYDTDSNDDIELSVFIKRGWAKAFFTEGYNNTDYEQKIIANFGDTHLYKAMKNFAKVCLE